MRDNFLHKTSAEMKTCTESLISADLGIPFDYDGVLIENIVKENYETFLRIGFGNNGDIEIDDIIDGIQAAIYGYVLDSQYILITNKFTLKTLNYNSTKKSKWEVINLACALYLGLNPDVDINKYDIKLEN